MNDINEPSSQDQTDLLKKIEDDKCNFSNKLQEFEDKVAQEKSIPKFIYYSRNVPSEKASCSSNA